jgi:CRISPR/Cas system CMR-associated protein Cmr3 (group 5 of RAMP superfamily)
MFKDQKTAAAGHEETIEEEKKENDMKTKKHMLLLASALMLLLGALYLIQPRTTVSAQLPVLQLSPQAFTVRGYGGKCMEFGNLPEMIVLGGPGIYISDCNNSAAQ